MKSPYAELDTAGENLTEYQKTVVQNVFHHFPYTSMDACLESMNKEVKKGIMKLDWDSDEHFSIVGQYLSDFYDSEGEKSAQKTKYSKDDSFH